jgi:PKD repeat protein
LVPGEPCTQGSSSIANVMFYPGGAFPDAYDDALFFSDHNRRCIWVMKAGADGLPDPDRLEVFAHGEFLLTELQLGPDGDMYGVDLIGGRVLRYVYREDNHPPVAAFTADPSYGRAPLSVTFDATSSTDPNAADTLTYAWDLDGDQQYDDGTGATVAHTYTENGIVRAGLRVDDGNGGQDTATTEIQVGNTPPVVDFALPQASRTWEVGETVEYAATATDAEDGELPDSAYQWSLVIQHCPADCHAHEITRRTGPAGSFVAPDHEYPAHLELRLTVTDSDGLTTTASRRLDPRTVRITLDSSPPGLLLSAFFEVLPGPFTREVIVGSSLSITAISPQESGDEVYEFASWSDGGSAVHNIKAPAEPTTYTATFRKKTNLAAGRNAQASSSSGPGFGPRRATDGRTSTGWASDRDRRQWISVDLGREREVGRALLRWGDRHATAYTVQTSANRRDWTTAFTATAGDGGADQAVVRPVQARYVRVSITGGPGAGGRYHLREFEVYDG